MSNFTPISDLIKQQLLSQLFEQLDDAIFILDANLRYLSVNAAYEIIIGYNEAFLLGRPLGIYNPEFLSENERAILNEIATCLNDAGFYEKDFALATRYGQILNCHVTYSRQIINGSAFYIGRVRDISAVVKDKKQVTHLLNFNQLTGLPNRKVFLSQISDLLMNSSQEIIIARFNIDGFRNLASILGAKKANGLIKKFVERVAALELEALCCFAHFGGDDFALSFKCSDTHLVSYQLRRLMQVCEQPFIVEDSALSDQSFDTNIMSDSVLADDDLLDNNLIATDRALGNPSGSIKPQDKKIYLHFSIGVSRYPIHDTQLLGLLSKADKALHYVKEQGGDDICWYHNDLDTTTTANLILESELRTAIEECQFIPFYQPKVALQLGTIEGFEALVRWQHPTRGLLTPGDFIEAIIKYKLSFELFCQMATQIAQHLRHWQTLGFCQYVSINADAAEFNHPEFNPFVRGLFANNAIDPKQLHIEVTESSLILQHSHVKKQLLALKDLGVRLALDDFGTGYSSLSYLQDYPFDFIKIDKSFTDKITDNKTQQAIVKAILDLAVALGMQAIAEGIETQQQRVLLSQMGCAYGQGYWFSHPVCFNNATQMLTDRRTFL